MDNQLPVSTPEAEGIPSGAILAFLADAEESVDALHSLLLLRHGYVVAQGWWAPYVPELPHMLFSLSKSFTSTAVGLAVAEGLLSVTDTVLSLFPDEAPEEVSDHLAAMQVRHLLTMTTGHSENTMDHLYPAEVGRWVRAFLALPVAYEPGEHFLYNTGASYVLSAIVQKLTGMSLMDYLAPRLFEPLGIQDAWWEVSPEGVTMGGFGLNVKTEDIARFGQLILQKGVWQGKRILPEAWVEEATSRQVANSPNENTDWEQGYGYQFWRCRHNAFRGDGAFGQYCIVMPDQDAVIAITSGVGDMQAVLNLIWQHLLPAMGPEALPDDAEMQAALAHKLGSLALPLQSGAATSPWTMRVSGKTYVVELTEQKAVVDRHSAPEGAQVVEAITLTLQEEGGGTLTIRDGRGDHVLDFGYGVWRYGETALDHDAPRRVAASGAWVSDDTLVVKLCFYETPFVPTLTFRFSEGEVRYIFETNVSFGPTARPTLVGRSRDFQIAQL
jgi:CubicO group peptidase (beta-lactamase class C family)